MTQEKTLSKSDHESWWIWSCLKTWYGPQKITISRAKITISGLNHGIFGDPQTPHGYPTLSHLSVPDVQQHGLLRLNESPAAGAQTLLDLALGPLGGLYHPSLVKLGIVSDWVYHMSDDTSEVMAWGHRKC